MNEPHSFQLKNLGIEHIKELPGGLPEFEEFSEKLNIISGPNGSGKSSTARTIQRIIWNQESQEPINITARAVFGEHDWLFKSRDGLTNQYIDKRESGLENLLPAAEAKDRYLLSLHDLIKSDDEDLARLMVRESNGGYDIEEAKTQLGYSETIRNKGLSEFKRVEDAGRKAEEIKQDQLTHKKEQQELHELYQKKKRITESEREIVFLKRAKEVKNSERKIAELKARKEIFPPQMQSLRESDYADVQELEKKNDQLKHEQSSTENELESVRSEIFRLQLPENGIPENLVYELEEYARKLNECEKTKESLRIEIERTREKINEIKKSIQTSESLQTEKCTIDDSTVEEFEKLQLRASELRDKTETLNQLASLYESTLSKEQKVDANQLEKAIELLSFWPGEAVLGASFSKMKLSLIAILILISAVLTWVQPVWGVALSGLSLMVLLGFGITAVNNQKKQRENIKNEFDLIGFDAPEKWSSDEIERLKQQLITQFQTTLKDEILQIELKRVKSELSQTLPSWTEIEQKMNVLLDETGVSPGFESKNEQHYQTLYWFLKRLLQLVDAENLMRELTAGLKETERQFEEFKSKANDLLRTSGFEEGENATQISGKYQTLNKRANRWRELKSEEKSLKEKASRIDQQQNENAKKRENLYQRLQVDVGDVNGVYELHRQRDSFAELVQNIAFAEKDLEQKNEELSSVKIHDSQKYKLDSDVGQIESELENLTRIVSQKEEVYQRITEIETIVQRLKSQQNLEQAIGELDASKEELRMKYEENIRSIAGHTITQELVRELQFNNQSEMFKRAAGLFADITAGRYQLRTGSGEDSGFYTWDSVLDEPKKLNELSTGTRVQLLLSVRLAFIESQEKSLKLPLLADELLANSDDERASKIIEALWRVSENGRQIFYFTAQEDEVAKWKQALETMKYPDLAHFYRLSMDGKHHNSQKVDPREIPDIPFSGHAEIRPPKPDESYQTYVQSLELPRFNPLKETVSDLHVWHILDKSSELFRLLNHGIHKYGALRYLNEMETLPEDVDENLTQKITKRAKLIKTYRDLITIGKHQRVNRTHLIKSGQVNDTFIDEATALLETLDHNPKEFIEALKNGELKRFRTKNTEELELWFIENGFISEREELEDEQIRLRLMSAAAANNVSTDVLEMLLNRLM